jgi:hypothetical protein
VPVVVKVATSDETAVPYGTVTEISVPDMIPVTLVERALFFADVKPKAVIV